MPPQILLVDDDPILTNSIKNALYKEKYQIITSTSANDALNILASRPCDVVVSDEQMPGLSGSEFLSIVCKQYPDIIRIMLTGQATAEGAMRAINQGKVYRFIMKPCNVLDLAITIRKAIEHRELVKMANNMTTHLMSMTYALNAIMNDYPEQKEILKNKKCTFHCDEIDIESLLDRMGREIKRSQELIAGNIKSVDDCHLEMTAGTTIKTDRQSSPSDVPASDQTPQKNSDSSSTAPTEEIGRPSVHVPANIMPVLESQDQLKSIKPLMSRAALRDRLMECSELKAISPTVSQLMKLTGHKNCTIDQIVKVIKQDQGIALKIMKLANSSVYTRGEPVNTIRKAVMRIGLTQIRNVVMNISVIDSFGTMNDEKVIKPALFWEHSISTGLIAAELVRGLEGSEQEIEAAFTMGLLHDVGKMVYAEILGSQYDQVCQVSQNLQLPQEQVELRMLLVNHADAMDRILRIWHFPQELINPIALHQLSLGNIRRLAPRTLKEVATLALANCLSHALLLGSSGNQTLYSTEDFAEALSIPAKLIDRLIVEIPDQTIDMKYAMLNMSSQGTGWKSMLEQTTDQLVEPLTPLYLSSRPEYDAIRIFVDQISASSETPNMGIIHLRNAREQFVLTEKFRQLEKNAQSDRLPLLIFSPNGNLGLDNREMNGRVFDMLPLPVTMSRIISSVNRLLESHSS